jgi:hypothetical protein
MENVLWRKNYFFLLKISNDGDMIPEDNLEII